MNTEFPSISPLQAENLTLGYDKKIIAQDLSVSIPQGELTVIIGPNGCGKSTLLRTLSRLIQPQKGIVWLNGRQISEYPTKEVARQLGLLPQSSIAQGILPCSIWLPVAVIPINACSAVGGRKISKRWSKPWVLPVWPNSPITQ